MRFTVCPSLAVAVTTLALCDPATTAGRAGTLWAADPTSVEHETRTPHRNDDTGRDAPYACGKFEQPFYDRLAADEIKTGGIGLKYELTGREGKFVGWFGVVRDLIEDVAA
ncbi:MAG TPA: hypothetical protein VGX78_16195, partial [Pirellulales bacterium]|nr:hypothetical protein [Pirellulales bacterium]